MKLAQTKLVDKLAFLEPFWIARFGDWLYLFDHPSGRMLGKPIFNPASKAALLAQQETEK